MDSTWADSQPAISAITEIELLCWKTTIEKDQEVLHNFIADAWVFELEKDSKLKTAELRRAHKDPCSLNPAPCLRKQVYRGLRLQS